MSGDFAALLREIGMDRKALATRSNVSGKQLWEYVTGRREPVARNVRRLAAALGVDPGRVLTACATSRAMRLASEARTTPPAREAE